MNVRRIALAAVVAWMVSLGIVWQWVMYPITAAMGLARSGETSAPRSGAKPTLQTSEV